MLAREGERRLDIRDPGRLHDEQHADEADHDGDPTTDVNMFFEQRDRKGGHDERSAERDRHRIGQGQKADRCKKEEEGRDTA